MRIINYKLEIKKEKGQIYNIRLLFLIFNFSFFISLTSCESDLETIQQFAVKQGMPTETMRDAEIVYSDSGKVKMKLTGKKLERYQSENPYILFPEGVHVLFYDDTLAINSELKADYGIRFEKEGKMEARKNVVVINIKGERMNTEHLVWEDGKDRIYSDEFVKIATGDEVIYGDGLEANRDFTRWRITNVKGVINIKDEESIEAK